MLKPGTRVVVVGAKHPWRSVAGTLAAYERFGIASRGWCVTLDNGYECYAAPDELIAAAPPPQRGTYRHRRLGMAANLRWPTVPGRAGLEICACGRGHTDFSPEKLCRFCRWE